MRWIGLLLFSIIIFPVYILSTHGLDNFSMEDSLKTEDTAPEPSESNEQRSVTSIAHTPATTTSSTGDIKSDYLNKLNQLEETVWEQINELEKQAETDLGNTSNAVQRGATLLKYERKARKIEEETDKQFAEIVEELEGNLQSEHISQHLSKELTAEYQDRKSKLKSSIYQEVNAFLSES